MNITFYDSEASTIEFNRKFISLPSYILIADSVQLIANSCWTNLFTTDFNTITDNEIFDFAIIYYAKTEGESDRIAHFRNQYAILKKTIQNKHKDKHTAIAVEYFRTGIKHLRTGLSKEYIDFLNFYSLQELYPFLKDKTW